jgi:hypothetical protein
MRQNTSRARQITGTSAATRLLSCTRRGDGQRALEVAVAAFDRALLAL